ncbi:MAG: tRNA (adenosine(37)-N6)-threonylcarbamoyltransferase complex transferase subunit TsaD [Candidatus Paceibacterota bacterium]|jgi:N6-L-threonylcarbamoyladenine synthase|nr:tRNA (adenosine(37)-N6)-threonylcarbamoyltransferase complex transferase subunit TsaD [Candidatus Paceibacterota bacterium]
MKILAIETSCDETAISIIEVPRSEKTLTVLSNIVVSQIAVHKPYGGVFPMLAKREHAKNLVPVLEAALRESRLYQEKTSGRTVLPEIKTILAEIFEREPELLEAFLPLTASIKTPKIDAIAFTRGPGLAPALWVGVNFARALSAVWEKPLVPINHMEGHMLSALLKRSGENKKTISLPNFPILALLISGGHTEIVLAKDLFKYKVIGSTRDDAVGEAFDKAARILGLPYPGGPEISRRASKFRESPCFAKTAQGKGKYKLPRPMIKSDDLDFSFSGIKTAVLYMVQKIPKMTEEIREEICYEFEEAVTETLLSKTMRAAEKYAPNMILLGGGVAANTHIQTTFKSAFLRNFPDAEVCVPENDLSTDNALMIAFAGYLRFMRDKKSILPAGSKKIKNLKADGNWSL